MKLHRALTPVIVIALVLAAGAYFLATSPYRGFTGEKFVKFERGTSTRAIAHQLAEMGVIRSEFLFLALRAVRPRATLLAGEYQFVEEASAWRVFNRLAIGDIYYFDLTIPEGSNIWDIARLLESQGIIAESDFLAAASDPMLIRDIAPDAASLEGFLFPSTYRLSHSTTAQELCKMMVDQFRKQWKNLAGATDRSPNEVLTLASLVEKETGYPEERSLIAGVFAHRLRIGMALACDPTVIYAALLSGAYRGRIYVADLERQHPYNTYVRMGLPPGPIANPGIAAIKAALNPTKTDYLYFVAKAEGGGHTFSATNEAHAEAVRNYRNAIAAQALARKAH